MDNPNKQVYIVLMMIALFVALMMQASIATSLLVHR